MPSFVRVAISGQALPESGNVEGGKLSSMELDGVSRSLEWAIP